MSTLVAHSDLNRSILSLYSIITWACAIIAVIVFGILAVILLRFRERGGAAPGLPRQIHGHTVMELAWTIAPALILLVIAIPTIQVIFRTQTAASPKNALEVTVRGLAVVVGVPVPEARRHDRQRAAPAGRPPGRRSSSSRPT